MDRNLMIHVPAGVYYAYRNPKINWNYQTEAEPHLFDRSIETPRGKVVGGSSSINSMVYMRGHPLDYDHWADELSLKQWRYEHCLPYFRAGETSDRGSDQWRGGSGELGVSQAGYDNPLYDAFLQAGEQAGQGHSDDLNGYKPEGIARFDATRRDGKRCSAAVAFLHPALHRKNLTLITQAQVKRVVLQDKRAVAVAFSQGGKDHSVQVGKEVVLSGGAINSPQVLMLSGIGPADQLRKVGIDPLHDAPQVGQNLQDHATVVMQWRCLEPVSMHHASRLHHQAWTGLQWLVNRSGLATTNIWEAGGLIRGNDRVAYPNLQYHFGPVGFTESNGRLQLQQGFTLHVDQLRPRSRGHIQLRSANPADKPAIQFNYLSTDFDVTELVEGVRKARELVAQPAFDRFRGEEIVPGIAAQTDRDLANAIRNMSGTDYHPCGTCRMGEDEEAVVDGEMRVRGIAGLRVVDASVLPRIISANLNAPVQMIAARAADFILGNPQRKAERAQFHFQSN